MLLQCAKVTVIEVPSFQTHRGEARFLATGLRAGRLITVVFTWRGSKRRIISAWTRARLVMPRRKASIHLRVDPEVLDWFKQYSKGYLTHMNAVLRSYYEAHRGNRGS
jgi:BrnA antitoxin of type II toxin-antitoxin system/Ribonuclease toxin, BrnT, of type II toxin-antitoxin system